MTSSLPDLSPAQRSEVELLARGKQDKSRTLRDLKLPETPQSAHALLLRLGLWTEQNVPFPDRAGVALASPELPVPAWPDEPRLDLTHLTALAIDDDGNRDPDDALSLEVLPDGLRRLWIHVADVAALVPPDSELDLEARRRGATLYLPDHTSGMLPDALVEQVGLGLHPQSPALSISIDFGSDGQAESVDVQLTRLQVTRLSYREAQERLDAGDPLLGGLHQLAQASRALRQAEGALSIDLPEVLVKVQAGEVSIRPLPRYDSRFVVQECMTLAGWAAAIYADDLEIALPFATQDPPHRDSPPGDSLPAQWARRKTLSRTRFQPLLGPHSGMGLDAYAQCTSPIRRYLDLVVHQQLRAALKEEEGLSGREIAARVAEATMNAGAVRSAEREARRHWTLVQLQRHPEQTYPAVVVDRRGPQATLLLPDLALDAPLTTPAPLGSELTVQLASVDLPAQTVRFRQVGPG
ncbi:RNB domain-containing ribonuclease [Deinococcus sonorensis]|uniref:RNB domain-containing ribonuclease n=2 Tax=Deinococcus sonorensis TaxID=309891 RepID=A0AAU7UE55_9DEIO